MSQSTAAVRIAGPASRAAKRPPSRPARPPAPARLRVVTPPPQARSRAGLVIGCLTLLAAGLVGLLLLNVSLEKGAFVRRHQQAALEQLHDQRQALQEELAGLEAPQALAGRAAALGMVEAPNAAFVRTSDGVVLGVPSRAVKSKSLSVTIGPAPTSGRGAGAGPAASPAPGGGAAAGTAKAPAKVTATGTGKLAATTTAPAPAGARKPATKVAKQPAGRP